MIGNEAVRWQLERHLPRVSLLYGPPSIGKTTLVKHLALYYGIGIYDVFTVGGSLTIDVARNLQRWSATAPFGELRLADVCLDNSSSGAQNALLKVLEEPPPTLRVILRASKPVIDTVRSRCAFYRMSALSNEQVTEVLVGQGWSRARATRAAERSDGRVAQAIAADKNSDEQRESVVAVMRAISLGDRDGFHRAFTVWNERAGDLLATWFTEAVTGQHRVYTPEEIFGMQADRPRLVAMMSALNAVNHARPKLAARSALEPFLSS